MSYSAGVYISPTKPRTRAFTNRFINIALNHSVSHTPQKKDELFRAVEEGELDRVQELVRHVGPSVTRGRKEYTLLHVAAENNRPHVTLFLLQLISPNVLVGHLFEAVLNEDVGRVRSLLRVGADADQHAVRDATGWLARELQITSVRHLARVLHHDSILRVFDAVRRTRNFKSEPCTATHHSIDFPSPPHKKIQPSPVEVSGPDVYRMDSAPRGYVCLLSYGSFQDRPDLHLEGSQTDAHHLASVFSRMGYSGHAHFSLTADQTRHQLAKVRDMEVLARAGCAVYVISSHGEPRRHFLTSDMHTLDVQWVMDFFKDSQCPHLRNKPKLFIWDLCRGHQEGESGRGKTSGQLCGRVDEPLRDVVCLDSSSGGFTWHAFSEEGTPFIGALCTTLARHSPTKELAELYREFLKEYATAAPDAVPQLTNYGLNKRFYF
ncbi:Caspase Dronc [Chionoecetes opilio]|uniref:Caspase Dronc n=1 Tax=Chionoecetes opilio TaxID=41210 RepID=A0A8J4YTU2_CHIOP|nr:Caspase Dronc [Chionoecetes opilio]